MAKQQKCKRRKRQPAGELRKLIGTGVSGCVYLLHFEQRINTDHPCQHYLGWAENLDNRLAAHKAGRGGRLPAVAKELGIAFEVVRVWHGVDRYFEAWLKQRKNGPQFCPVCSGPQALRRAHIGGPPE